MAWHDEQAAPLVAALCLCVAVLLHLMRDICKVVVVIIFCAQVLCADMVPVRRDMNPACYTRQYNAIWPTTISGGKRPLAHVKKPIPATRLVHISGELSPTMK